MQDNQLFTILFSILKTGFVTLQMPLIQFQQNYQPTQQGTPSIPTIFVYKIGPDELMGTPARSGIQGEGSASFIGSVAGNILQVTSVSAGTVAVNQAISGIGVPANTIITEFGTGTGGVGTYVLSQSIPTITGESLSSTGTWVDTYLQQYLSHFQASALATQDPANVNSLTASDLLNYAASVLQSDTSISTLETQGIGILKISQARNTYFSDDRQRYEASPSFDFTLSHKQTIITSVPVVTEEVFRVLPV